jgi:hypothetical protein
LKRRPAEASDAEADAEADSAKSLFRSKTLGQVPIWDKPMMVCNKLLSETNQIQFQYRELVKKNRSLECCLLKSSGPLEMIL